MTIKEKIQNFQNIFNTLFEKEIKKILKEQQDFNPVITDLDEPLTQFVLDYTRGGKRIRPFLIDFFSDQDIEQSSELQDICIAVELFHLAALIHDDIMDQSETRRGVATLHVAAQTFAKENKRLGHDVALLIGDVFLASAISKAAGLNEKIFEEFRLMIKRTIHGQYLDSFGMNQVFGSTPRDEVYARHELKTAWYTFVSPARIGYLLSENQDPQHQDTLSKYMRELGILFQIRDDIIDCIDNNSGKPKFGDIFENQTTWVTLHIQDHHPESFKKIIQAKESHNIQELELIFNELNLKDVYKQEFAKRADMIHHLDESSPFKSTLVEILDLLELN